MNRQNKHEIFMEIARVIAKRTTCLKKQVGAVIVKDGYIVSTGYNGAPKGIAHCIDTGICVKQKAEEEGNTLRYESCVAVHAEQNAIIQAAKFSVSVKDASMYVTYQPCIMCTKMIINAGIRILYIDEETPEEIEVMNMLRSVGIKVIFMKDLKND